MALPDLVVSDGSVDGSCVPRAERRRCSRIERRSLENLDHTRDLDRDLRWAIRRRLRDRHHRRPSRQVFKRAGHEHRSKVGSTATGLSADRGPTFSAIGGARSEPRHAHIGELLALEWSAVDLDAGTVSVVASIDRVGCVIVEPKTRTSRRMVPLTPSDVAMLRRHKLASDRRDGFVFATPGGKPLPPNAVPRHAWQRVGVVVAEPAPRLHDLRYAYASRQLAAGLSGHAVARRPDRRDRAGVR
jgi:integrase